MNEEYYTIRDIMAKFQISYPTVLKLIKEKKIKAVMIKNKYLIPKKEIEKILQR